MSDDIKIFDNISMTDLYREAYNRSYDRKNQLATILLDIQKHIQDKNDAITMLPRIKEFMDVGVKNDETLIKLISIIQKMETLKSDGSDGEILSEEEKEQLRNSIDSTISDLTKSVIMPIEKFKV